MAARSTRSWRGLGAAASASPMALGMGAGVPWQAARGGARGQRPTAPSAAQPSLPERGRAAGRRCRLLPVLGLTGGYGEKGAGGVPSPPGRGTV